MANKNVKQQGQPVEETLNKQEAFFMKYKKAIIIAVVAIIAIVAGTILYNNLYKQPHEAEASTVLAKGQELFMSGDFEKALNGDKAGFGGFLKVASDYSGTKAGNLAELYAGLCYANLGKWNEAINYLEKYSPASDQMVGPAAVAALGNAYAHVDQLDKAVQNLKKAAKMADDKAADGINNSIAPTFLVQAAEILEKQGKKDEALAIYQDIKKKYVNASISQEILLFQVFGQMSVEVEQTLEGDVEDPEDREDEVHHEADRVGPGLVFHPVHDDLVRQPDQQGTDGADGEKRQRKQRCEGAEALQVVAPGPFRTDERHVGVVQPGAKLAVDLRLRAPFAPGEFLADLDRLADPDADAPLPAEIILIIDTDRHDAHGYAQLVVRHPGDAEDAFLDGQHLALRVVRAFRIEAEGDLVVQAVDDFLEGVEILGHLGEAVALARDGQDAQPAQDLGDFRVGEDVGTGAEDDRLAAEQDQRQERVHQGRAVVGGQDHGAVLRVLSF